MRLPAGAGPISDPKVHSTIVRVTSSGLKGPPDWVFGAKKTRALSGLALASGGRRREGVGEASMVLVYDYRSSQAFLD